MVHHSSSPTFAQRQRVEVERTVAGVPTYDIGTVIDQPTEDLVRVELDAQPGVRKVYDVRDVHEIPSAVSRHITRLISALAAVSDDERPEVEASLRQRLQLHGDLIGWAREVHDDIAARGGAA